MGRNRSSISCYLKDVVDDTEEFVDDVLERAEDVECDIRQSLSDALDCDDWDDDWDDWEDGRDRDGGGKRRKRRRRRRGEGRGKTAGPRVPRPASGPSRSPELEALRSQVAELAEKVAELTASRT